MRVFIGDFVKSKAIVAWRPTRSWIPLFPISTSWQIDLAPRFPIPPTWSSEQILSPGREERSRKGDYSTTCDDFLPIFLPRNCQTSRFRHSLEKFKHRRWVPKRMDFLFSFLSSAMIDRLSRARGNSCS